MPSIVVKFDNPAGDVRFKGFRSGTTAGPITNVTGYEYEDQAPYTTGFPIRGTDSSAGLTEHKANLIFSSVIIPKGSKIENAEIILFAKVQGPQTGNPPMQINISAHDTFETASQDPKSYTSVFTSPVRAEKGTFTLTAGETSYVEKKCNVTGLVQELVNQFDFKRNGEMRLRMTNKSFTVTQQAYPYPRPTTVPPSFTAPSTDFGAQIYAFEQGGERSAKLIVTYSNPCTETLCDDFSYNINSFQDRNLNDPSDAGDQISADTAFPTSDPARIRINAPFGGAGSVNRLDLSCPAGIPHNASGTGEDFGGAGGTFGGGPINDLQWNYRFKIDITSFVINTDPTGQSVHIGLGDSGNAVTSDLAQDYIGFKIGNAGSVGSFNLVGANGIGPDTGGAIEGTFTTPVTTGVFFVELAREGNSAGFSNISCSLFRDKDYSDLIEKVSGITPTGIVGLDRLKFMVKNIDGTGNGLIVVEYGQQIRFPTSAQQQATGKVELKAGSVVALGHAVAREPAVELTTFEDDLESPANFVDTAFFSWTNVGVGFGQNVGNLELDWSANNAITNNATEINLNNTDVVISRDMWTLRFKLDIDVLTNGTSAVENQVFFGLSNASSVSNPPTTNQASLGLMASINNTTVAFRTTWSQLGITPLFSNTTAFSTAVPSVGTVFVEIIRNSTTSMTVNIYSDKTFKTLIESVTDTGVASNIGNFDFIKLSSRSDGTGADSTLNGSIDNLQFFSQLSSVPSNWAEVGIGVEENQTTGVIDWTSIPDGTSKTSVHDLVTPASDISWTLRFKFTIDSQEAFVVPNQGKYFWIGLFDSDQTVDSESTQDFLGFFFSRSTVQGILALAERNGVILSNAGTDLEFSNAIDPVVGDIWYIEIKRTSTTSVECTIYSDSDYTHVVETLTLTISAGITGLRYIGLKNRAVPVTGTGGFNGTVDDVQFWNGQDELELNNNWRVSN